jgi:hypothetical protein
MSTAERDAPELANAFTEPAEVEQVDVTLRKGPVTLLGAHCAPASTIKWRPMCRALHLQ